MNEEPLYISATEETPEVKLSLHDENLYICGRSFPENAYEFYRPIIQWISSHCQQFTKPAQLELRFDYFNSSSGRFLFEMLSHIERSPKKSLLSIIWVVEKGDELMMEKGLELQSLLDLQFEVREEI